MRDDLAALANAAVSAGLGIPITWIDADGDQFTTTPDGDELLGVFDDRHQELPATDASMSRTGPWVAVTLSDLQNFDPDAETTYGAVAPGFIIRGITYRISDFQPNGLGSARFYLKVAPE